MSTEEEVERHVRPFSEWLLAQRKGGLNIELGDALADLVTAVGETNKGGTLTLTIKVAPGRGTSLEVKDECKTKLPEHDREITLWWSDDDGNLMRYDPHQQQIPFGPRAVDAPPENVDAETGEITKEGAGA